MSCFLFQNLKKNYLIRPSHHFLNLKNKFYNFLKTNLLFNSKKGSKSKVNCLKIKIEVECAFLCLSQGLTCWIKKKILSFISTHDLSKPAIGAQENKDTLPRFDFGTVYNINFDILGQFTLFTSIFWDSLQYSLRYFGTVYTIYFDILGQFTLFTSIFWDSLHYSLRYFGTVYTIHFDI